MIERIKLFFTLTIILLMFPLAGHAVLVMPGQSPIYSFDSSALGEIQINSFTYITSACSLDDGNETCLLGGGKSFDLVFGTTPGSGDIGTNTFTSGHTLSINNVGSALTPKHLVAASVSTIYLSLVYVDDVFDVEIITLETKEASLGRGDFVGISSVPLPAAFWLFGAALVGFAGYSKRLNKLDA